MEDTCSEGEQKIGVQSALLINSGLTDCGLGGISDGKLEGSAEARKNVKEIGSN